MGSRFDLKQCTIKIKDGTAVTPLSVTVKIGSGNLTWTESQPRIYEMDRGVLDQVRNGDQVPMDVSLDCVWDYILADSGVSEAESPVDAVKRRGTIWGATPGAISTGATCEPFAVNLELKRTPVCVVSEDPETITFPQFRYETIDFDPKEARFSMKGKCNAIQPTIVRT